jgi:hypothetical protein
MEGLESVMHVFIGQMKSAPYSRIMADADEGGYEYFELRFVLDGTATLTSMQRSTVYFTVEDFDGTSEHHAISADNGGAERVLARHVAVLQWLQQQRDRIDTIILVGGDLKTERRSPLLPHVGGLLECTR